MTLLQMEYIVALDTYRHFVKAAEACGVSQSTLSTLVKKLEEELDTVIFNRDAHPLAPTKAGEKLIAQARVILYNIEQLKEMSLNEKEASGGDVRVAVIPTVSPYIVPKLFKRLREDSPEIQAHIFEMQTSEILEKLARAELDMAIMATPLEEDTLLEVPIYYEKLVMYVAPDEPLSKKSEIISNEIPSSHLWMLKEGHCLRNQVLNLCEKISDYKAIFEAGSINTLVNIVDENGGYTVIPELHIELLRDYQQKNIRPLVDPEPVREISLVFRRDFVRERILNEIASAVKKIIPEHMIDSRLKKFAIKL